MKERCFWLACILSLSFHICWLGLLCAFQLLQPISPPMLLLSYGDSDVEGLSVSAVAGDPGAMVQATQDRPGGEVLPGPIRREFAAPGETPPTPIPAQATAPAPQPTPSNEVVSLEKPPPKDPPKEEETPRPLPDQAPSFASPAAAVSALPTPLVPGETKPAGASSALAGAAKGSQAPNGMGVNPLETPGVGKAAGSQGSSRMAAGTPSAGGRVGTTSGVSLLSHPRPVYPPAARRAGQEGTVLVWLRVSAAGRVVEARVERSSGYPLLDEAAMSFAFTVHLQPARQGTTPVVAETKLPVVYRLVD